VTHKSDQPISTGVSGFSEKLAETGMVLINLVGPLRKLGRPFARQRLLQPYENLLTYKLRGSAGNDGGVILDPGRTRGTVNAAGFLVAR
jgi:hypothetical protein